MATKHSQDLLIAYQMHKPFIYLKYLCDSTHCSLFFSFLFIYLFFLGPHPWHMEVCRLEVESELQLPAYTSATAMRDLSCLCILHCGSQQCQSLTHWASPGVEPMYSWILIRFITAEPWQDSNTHCSLLKCGSVHVQEHSGRNLKP